MVSATMRGRRVYSTEAYGNAYFFRGDGGSELERYCVKSIITCVRKAGSFVGSRPCPERIFQDLLAGVTGNNDGWRRRALGAPAEKTCPRRVDEILTYERARVCVNETRRAGVPI